MADATDQDVPGHRLEARIARGPHATVHLATQLPQGRTVALKVLASPEARVREQFVREGAAAAAHPHPHLVPAIAAGQAGASAWLSMRHIDGPTLAGLLRAPGGVEVRRSLDLLEQVAGALDSLAARGAVHGAVRPDNVLVGPGDHAYLTDLGVAVALRPGPLHAAGPAADLRALADTAHEALSGVAPARGGPPASARNPALGPEVDAALARPAASAGAFVAGVAAAVAATPGAASSRAAAPSAPPPPPPPRPRPGAAAPPPPPPPPPAPAPPRAAPVPAAVGGPRWRVPAIVFGVLAALGITLGVIGALSDGGGGPRTVTEVVVASAPSATTAPGLSATFPLGAVLPAAIDGWELDGTDPAVVNLELQREGEVETAQARGPSGTGLLAGVRPSSGDGRVVVERIRQALGGDPGGAVPLGGAAGDGQIQSRGGVWAVTFGLPDRVVIAIAGDRAAAVSLATAASEALHP